MIGYFKLTPNPVPPTVTLHDLTGEGTVTVLEIAPSSPELILQLATVLQGVPGAQGPKGDKGDTGATGANGSGSSGTVNSIAITVDTDNQATVGAVENDGTSVDYAFKLTIPAYGTTSELEFTASVDGAQTGTLLFPPALTACLFINGLRQSKSSWSVVGEQLIIPDDLNVRVEDLITFLY